MTHNLDANVIGTAEYRRTYRARGWRFSSDTCDDLRATTVATVQGS